MRFFHRVGQALGYCTTALALLVAAMLLASAYSPWVDPTVHARLSCLGLAFPLCAVGNGVVLVACLIGRSYRRALVPLVAFVLCMPQLRAYCPINLGPRDEVVSGRSLRLVSYNVMGFPTGGQSDDSRRAMLAYLDSCGADIICMQEYNVSLGRRDVRQKDVDRALSDTFPYHHIASAQPQGGSVLACYSRYPIVSAQRLPVVSRQNGSMLYRIVLPQGDTLCLINNHLESNHIDPEDREIYEDLLHGPADRSTAEAGARHLLAKLAHAAAIRGPQADSVARVINGLLDEPSGEVERGPTAHRLVVACGDLNDSPISYARRRLSSRLRDAFARGGNGLGLSYNRNHFLFRIDHVFVDRRIDVKACCVDRSIHGSDHYPICCTLELPR